jgi:glycosyltransferase involved in cell wall biosynthesis
MTSNADSKKTSDLRVAIFSDSFPERNGAGAYYSDLSEQLEARLGGVKVFQPMVKNRLFLWLALPLPGDKTQKVITPNVFRIFREYKELNPHLAIAVTPGPFGLVGLYLAKRNKIGFLTAFHTHFEGLVQMYGDTPFFRFCNWYLELINKILLKRSDSVLLPNETLVPTVNKLGALKHDVMGTPLARSFLQTPTVPPSGQLKRIIFAGRLAPEKNLSVVLEAVRALPEIEFVMAGEGPLRKQMEKEAESLPNLRLTGWLSRDELLKEVDGSDLLILPSHSDALFVLNPDQSIVEVLKDLQDLPAETWNEKAEAARSAAVALNDQTIDQWVGFVEQYARSRDD